MHRFRDISDAALPAMVIQPVKHYFEFRRKSNPCLLRARPDNGGIDTTDDSHVIAKFHSYLPNLKMLPIPYSEFQAIIKHRRIE
jgi:hypothetical protein